MRGILESLLYPAPRAEQGAMRTPGPADDFWYNAVTGVREPLTVMRAQHARAVWACMRVRAESTGILPLVVYRQVGRKKQRATDHWLYRLLHDSPNEWMAPFEFQQLIANHLDARGIFAAVKVPGDRLGEVRELLPLHPDRLTIKVMEREAGRPAVIYRYRTAQGQSFEFVRSELFIVMFATLDGVTPLSPLGAAAAAVNLSLTQADHAQRFMDNDATSALAVINKHTFKSAEEREKDREAFQQRQTGPNKYKAIYIQGDADVKTLSLSNRDSQFIESRKFQVEEICGFFRVPPHMIGHLERSTNNNIEHQGIQWARLDLMPTLRRIEQAGNDLSDEDGIYCKFLVDALERGDITTRYAAHASSLTTGWKTVNEVREAENLDPVNGGDELREPLNMSSSSERAKAIALHQVQRLAALEVEAIAKAAQAHADDPEGWEAAVRAFYAKHGPLVSTALQVELSAALAYGRHMAEDVAAMGAAALQDLRGRAEAALLELITEDDDAEPQVA